MTHRLLTAVCKADVNLRSALFRGNLNIIQQPRRLELRQFLSQLSSHPPKGFGKPFNQKNGNSNGMWVGRGIGAGRKSSSLSGGMGSPEGDDEKGKVGPDGKNERQNFSGNAGILEAFSCALAIPDVESNPDDTLPKRPNAFYQEMTDGENEKESKSVDLAQLVHAAKSTDPQIQCGAVNLLRKVLSSGPNPPIDVLISCNILPTLVDCLSSPNPALQCDALWALAEIFVRTSYQQTQAVVEAGAVPHFLRLLTSPDQNVRENALSALGTHFGPQLALVVLAIFVEEDCATVQAVIDAGLIPLVLRNLEKGELQTQKAAFSALRTLIVRGNKQEVANLIDCGVVPPLCNLLNCKDLKVVKIVLEGIYNILSKSWSDDDLRSVNQSDGYKAYTLIKECGGGEKIETLKRHENIQIRQIAFLTDSRMRLNFQLEEFRKLKEKRALLRKAFENLTL